METDRLGTWNKIQDLSLDDFTRKLSSKDPIPGGGGASALVGALGIALGNMVGSLTVGKKKYIDVEAEMYELISECEVLRQELLALIDRDAEVFEPLARAYSMPKDTDEEKAERARVMASVLEDACLVPLEIMEKCCVALDMIQVFARKGSRLAVSDAGVGAAFCQAALQGASLNVFINTKIMVDRTRAEELNAQANEMLEKYVPLANEIVCYVTDILQKD